MFDSIIRSFVLSSLLHYTSYMKYRHLVIVSNSFPFFLFKQNTILFIPSAL